MTDTVRYAELQVTSHFSFLRGASSCEELFSQAAALGIEALAIADRNSVAGIVRAHQATKETGVRLIVGCRLDLTDGLSVLVYPTDRPAYARLCRLLSLGKGRGGKGKCILAARTVIAHRSCVSLGAERGRALPPSRDAVSRASAKQRLWSWTQVSVSLFRSQFL